MRLIDADMVEPHEQLESFSNGQAEFVMVAYMDDINELPTIDTVPVTRCGECKHRPTGNRTEGLNFPDYKCPCRCEDEWYSWKPDSNWFCANGEK